MILPKAEFLGIFRGKPIEYCDRIRNGYLKISWKDSDDIYSASVVIRNGEPIMADVEFIKSKRILKGKEALERIFRVDYAVVELYSVDSGDIRKIVSMNDESLLIKVEEAVKKEEKVERKEKKVEEKVVKGEKEGVEEVKGVTKEVNNLEDYILNIKDFTGILKGIGKDRVATIYLKNGNIIGAKVELENEVFKGLPALYYIEFPAKVIMKEVGDVDKYVDEECRVERFLRDKKEIIEKLGIKPPDEEEIKEILSVLNELKFEGKFVNKVLRFFKKRKL
jgi:hypothetical protein